MQSLYFPFHVKILNRVKFESNFEKYRKRLLFLHFPTLKNELLSSTEEKFPQEQKEIKYTDTSVGQREKEPGAGGYTASPLFSPAPFFTASLGIGFKL